MKPIRKFLDKIKPHVQKGGKFEKLHSTFDAFETFLFVPDRVTKKGSHIRDSFDTKRAMIVVVIALVPALLFGMLNTGVQHYLSVSNVPHANWKNIISEFGVFPLLWYGFLKILPIIVVSYVAGLGTEFIFAQLRGHEVNEGFLVTGMLIPLIVPVSIPLWMVAVATIFAVIFGKEVFGGTGMNILNPALLTRAFLFFAYPAQISGDKVWIADKADTFSGATPMAHAAAGDISQIPSSWDMFLGFIPGSIGETSTLAILFGAAILLFAGIGSKRIMLSVVAGGLTMGLIFNAFAINEYMAIPAHYHLVMGGFAFGAIFMATDPVSGAQTGMGKWIYGFLIGIIAVIIRVLNPAYPEGMMLAILLMNVFAPLIDHYVVEANIKRRLKRIKVKA